MAVSGFWKCERKNQIPVAHVKAISGLNGSHSFMMAQTHLMACGLVVRACTTD